MKGRPERSEDLGGVGLSEKGKAGWGGGKDRKKFRLISMEAVYSGGPQMRAKDLTDLD